MKNERGSIAPLGIGLTVLLLATIIALVSAGSLYVFQARIKSLAEFAALSEAQTGLSVAEFLTETNQRQFLNLIVLRDETLDGRTVEVAICASWSPPLKLFDLTGEKRVCGKASARNG
jgi:hypothetical protein